MKKLFASLMAATMVAGMSVSAFAYVGDDNKSPEDSSNRSANAVAADGDYEDDYAFVAYENGTVHGGGKIYYPILVDASEVEDDDDVTAGYFYATKASEVEDLKASVKETQGKGSIKEVNIVRKDVSKFTGIDSTVTGKIYGIEIKLNDYFKDEKDLEFDLTLKNKSKEMLKVEDLFFTLGQDDSNSTLKGEAYKNAAGNYQYVDVNGAKHDITVNTIGGVEYGFANALDKDTPAKACIKAGKIVTPVGATAPAFREVVKVAESPEYGFGYDAKFKNDCLDLVVGGNTKLVTLDEWTNGDKIEELYMETADGEMIVEGYLEEQDPLFLEFTKDATDFQKAVMVENNDADVDTFVWSAHPTFDFSMDVRVPVEDDRDNFLYEVIDGKLVEVDAELNEDGDELEFKTKTLGEYLLSDKQLTAEKTEDALAEKAEAKEDAAKEDGVKENSETGAAIAVATVIALF